MPEAPKPQELRKIEKDKRRKKFEDLQVQGTNNSSIVSKRSVEIIYKDISPPGEWFKHFVPKGKRRSPAINRGYWIRMETIRQVIYKIMEKTDGNVNIINLGCGYDPLPFQLLHMNYKNITFYDIDYPELVNNKLEMIKKSPEILELIGESDGLKDLGLLYNTDNYKLFGCDLKNYSLFEKQLSLLKEGVNIFIAEVSLAYMHYDDANKIIELASKVPNSHFVILEQILPNGKYDSFAQKMLAHFSKLRSSLKCVEQYPEKKDQIARFKQYYKNAEIRDLFENWNELIDDDIKVRMESIEEFDEWEEFIMFCQHYVIVHACNDDNMVYKIPSKHVDLKENSSLKLKLSDIPSVELKFPASCAIDGEVFVNGGLFQVREDSTLKNSQKIETENNPLGRMCHSLTEIKGSKALLIGGRTRPGHLLKDVYKFDGKKWDKLKDLPFGIYRHSVIEINDEEVLIIGGQADSSRLPIYNHIEEETRFIEYDGDINFAQILSFGITYDGEVGYITGGITDKHLPSFNDKLIEFTINDKFNYEIIQQSPMLERVDPKLVKIQDEIVVVGGVNFNQLLNQNNLIISIKQDSILGVPIDEDIWVNKPPLFIGHTVVDNKILYGGAVCYSFGSAYSYNYYIE